MFNWLEKGIDWLVYQLMGLPVGSHFSSALHFFLYDSIKILILLFLIIWMMGIVNAYFPVERVRHFLSRKKLYGLEYFLASFFGAVTPFCSCSSVPLFIGFVKGGIPLGVTFAFLVTSPLVNEVALAMFLGMFGLKFTLIYALNGILLGMLSGWILGKMKLEPYLTDWVREIWEKAEAEQRNIETSPRSFWQRLPDINREALSIVKSVVLYVLVGIGIGAAMHGYVPEGFFERYLQAGAWYAVPLAVILAVPIYANAAGVIPVIQVFVAKGIPLGTSIAFMMGVVGLSLPEATLLKKVMTLKLIAIFFGVVTLCIILSGYLFNWIFG
ncbi:MAG: permease [Saprospirales bacterium]|jgi:uncharacterized membrane protein YraQ (UPF0718 family)|nr:permease [Saprospirales bacterium]MBK7335352.1 permease [Saprospirales bacterium]